MSVGVLLPSRGRPEALVACVESLWRRAIRPGSVEVVVAYDTDDEDTYQAAHSIGLRTLGFDDRPGYSQLHLYVNALAKLVGSDWLFLWNDDARMETDGWDCFTDDYDSSRPLVLSPSSTGVGHDMCCFPIVSRCLYDLLGHMSLSNHIDSWLQDLANSVGILRKLNSHIFHDRCDFTGGHNDQTYAERSMGYRTEDFYSERMQSLLRTDIEKVRSWST